MKKKNDHRICSFHRRLAVGLSLLVVVTSCGRDSRLATLEQVETLMETDAASARALLDSLPTEGLRGEAAARYAIVRTQTDYKCFVPLTTDSLIAEATRYYGDRRPSMHAAMAWYSLGCVRAEQGNDVLAVEAFLKASTLFPDTLSRYYALCQQNLGHHYSRRGLFDEALEAYAAFNRSAAVSERDTLVNNYHIGKVLVEQGRADEATAVFGALIGNASASAGLKQKAHFELAKVACYLQKDYAGALRHARACREGKQFGAVSSVMADASLGLGRTDSAVYYFREALGQEEELFTQCNICRKMGDLSVALGQYDSVTVWVDRYTVLADSVWRQRNNTALVEVMNRHEAQLQAQALRARQQRTRATLIFVAFVLATAITLAFLSIDRYHKAVRLRLQKQLSKAQLEIFRQKEQIESMINPNPEDTARLAELRRQRCQYSRQAFLLTPWARRLRELEESGEELTLHDHDELRAVLADCFADTMVDLKSDCPALNMDEAYFCIYSALGLTTNTVAQCERTSNVVLRKRKSRIKEKVGADWFSLFFSA